MTDSQQLRERTLVVLKPDAVVRGLAGRIIQRFEDASLKVIGVKMREMDADFARKHYFDLEERTSPEVYQATATFMQRGPGPVRLARADSGGDRGADDDDRGRPPPGTLPGSLQPLLAGSQLRGQLRRGHEPAVQEGQRRDVPVSPLGPGDGEHDRLRRE